ncbi:MAG: FecR domain-containing protein [Gammaproteobacteria bacterium]|nr:FecR domain-containing protein [Gammaproteobacteria bacterium]
MKLRFFSLLVLILTLNLPSLAKAEQEYWEYTFRPGDSFWGIAEKYTTSANNWRELQKVNEIRQGTSRKIPPGTRIVIPISLLKNPPVPAIVIALSGSINVLRENGEKKALEIGSKLYSGDRVITEENQSLRLQFADKSELQVLSNSNIALDKLSHHKKTGMVDTRIRLNSGKINTNVKKQNKKSRYQIQTPAAITAVRGTAFRLSSDTNFMTRTEVTEGIVAVSVGGIEKTVKQGFGLVAEKGKPLQDPVKLLSPPKLNIKVSSDNTKLQLSWKKLEGAQYYRYMLAKDEKFTDVLRNETTKQNSIEFSIQEAGHYYLRARGVGHFQLEGFNSSTDVLIKPAVIKNETLRKITLPASTILLNL